MLSSFNPLSNLNGFILRKAEIEIECGGIDVVMEQQTEGLRRRNLIFLDGVSKVRWRQSLASIL